MLTWLLNCKSQEFKYCFFASAVCGLLAQIYTWSKMTREWQMHELEVAQ